MSLNDLKQLNVLYADDDLCLQESMGKTLEFFFGQVYLANNGLHAIELFNKKIIHVAFLDIRMPGLDGLEVAKRLREHSPDLPIIIISSYQEVPDLMQAIRLHLIDYVVKPVTLTRLKDVLSKVVEYMQAHELVCTEIDAELKYDYTRKQLLTAEGFIFLNKREVLFIELMLRRRGCLVSDEEIFGVVYGTEDRSLRALRNLVFRLRKKVGRPVVINVKELGYMLE